MGCYPGGQPGKDQVVFLGDSLTAGYGVDPSDAYPSSVGAYWQRHGITFRTLNAGISGDVTTELHLNADGNRIIARDVLAFLNPEWKLAT